MKPSGRGTPSMRGIRDAVGGEPLLPLVLLSGLVLVEQIDTSAFSTLVPEIRDYFGLSLGVVLLVGGMSGLLAVVFAVPVGFLADRWNRPRILAVATVLSAVAFGATSLAPTILVLALVRLGSGIPRASDPSVAALLSDSYSPASRGAVFSLQRVAYSFGLFVGPVAAGWLASLGGWQLPWIILAPITAVLALAFLAVPEPGRGATDLEANGIQAAESHLPPPTLGEAWRTALGVRTLRRIWWALPFLIGLLGPLAQFFSLYLSDVFEVGPAARGTITSFAELFAVLGVLVGLGAFGKLLATSPGRALGITGMLVVLAAACFIVVAVSPWLALAIGARYAGAFFAAISAPAATAVMTLVIPARVRGTALAFSGVFAAVGVLIGVVAGLTATAWGDRWGMGVWAVALLIGGLVFASAGSFVARDIAQAAAATAALAVGGDEGGPVFACRDLSAGYDGRPVLFGIDLDVHAGEIVAVVGANGAGKTTLLRAIAGTVGVQGGSIAFDGREVTFLPGVERMRLGIALVRGGDGVFPALTVGEHLRLSGARIEDALDLFPALRDRLDTPAGILSGGQQHMLALATSLGSNPRLLLVDEMSLGLSPAATDHLLTVIKAAASRGTAVVLVEQTAQRAALIADRAVLLQKGEIADSGPAAEIAARTDLVHAGRLRHRTGVDAARSAAVESPVLTVTGATVRFGSTEVVSGVDLTASAGEVLAIIGPNGAGKTTLFEAVSGHVPLAGGTIRIGEHDVTSLNASARARLGLHRTFQDSRLFGTLSVREAATLAATGTRPARALALSAVRADKDTAETVTEALTAVGLAAEEQRKVGDLSIGSRQLLTIGCALAAQPKLVLLDEPSAGLSAADTEALTPVLRSLAVDRRVAVVLIEHDLGLVASVADRVLCLSLGRVLAEGEPSAVLTDDAVIDAYLGSALTPTQ